MARKIGEAFERACLAEIDALKPGNVHRFAPGHGMTVEDFEKSARAAARVIAEPGIGVGGRIRAAIDATWDEVGCNTNLGIVLLAAPLIEAALAIPESGAKTESFREAVSAVLDHLTVKDAQDAFAAIARANPAGLGESPRHDVHRPADVTLREAMIEAAPRDSVARQYATGFRDVFELGVPRIREMENAPGRGAEARAWAAVSAYLAFLASFPDTHIERKYSKEQAAAVRAEAAEVDRAFRAAADPATLEPRLKSFDAALKASGLNPGTSADLTVASLLAADLLDIFPDQTASQSRDPLP